ncbi:MAG: endonuclease III [Acidobacteria bacterium]|nr:endonuclease III [Acidobacteriota bacterium]
MPAKKSNRESKAALHERAQQILARLIQLYPEPRCALNHGNAFELLIATILSAQCTDERVNIVTADLFRKYRKPVDYVNAQLAELEQDIRSTGFYHNKAKNIQGAAQTIVEKHQGKVPQTMDELHALPGVGRKTANVVLGNAFGIVSGIVVDTHVTRLSQRLGLTKEDNAEKIETALIPLIPETEWINFSHRLIAHGRQVCNARKPLCGQCKLADLCPSAAG